MKWLWIGLLTVVCFGFSNKPGEHSGMIRYHISGIQLIPLPGFYDQIRIEFNDYGGVTYDYDLAVQAIICCNPTHLEHAWCDTAKQDNRCKKL
ncbi:MAG: hypothetical protein J7L89_08595 [Bacteroidales bacterium]|nr:hypothetical protein [Bacteroidales bacterium]